MKKLILVAAFTGLSMLAGCMTVAQRQNVAQDQTCRSWGVKPGTEAYASCRLELSRQQLTRDMADDAALAAQQQANARAIAAMAPLPMPRSCTYNSSTVGGITNGVVNC
jgi:hypothetical protein